jgi:drug/metabolite transporter (DMT)-like permease
MLPFAWPQLREQWPAIRRDWKLIVWLGFWGTGLHNVFAYLGLQDTTATNGVILNSSVPIMIIVVGWLVYRDTLTRLQSLGVAISMAGVLVVLTRGDPSVLVSFSLNKGDLIVLVGMVFWAAYTVFLRMKPKELGGLAMLASCCIVGVLILLPMFIAEMLFFGGHVEIRPATIAAVAYVAIFPSFVGYVFWNRAVAEVGSNVAGIFMHLMPVFGSLLAWMFLGERIQLFHVAGIALILGGITLTTRAAPAPT